MKSRGYEHFWGRLLLPTKKHHQATNSESIKGKNGKSMQIAKMNLIYARLL